MFNYNNKMSFVLDKVSQDTFYENILLGLSKYLEKQSRFKNVLLNRYVACSSSEISSWEEFNGVKLPEDLKAFYMASNGFKLTWNYLFSIQEILPVGSIEINTISDLTFCEVKISLPPNMRKSKTDRTLKITSETKAFKLSVIDDQSFVALIYNTSRNLPNIFVVDENQDGYFLTNSFRKYIRMALVHMGLPYWQYCFTTHGLPTWVEQMFNTVAPHLPTTMPVPMDGDEEPDDSNITDIQTNTLDTSIFKCIIHETKKSFNTAFTNRKKH